jgi:hypothetical protein
MSTPETPTLPLFSPIPKQSPKEQTPLRYIYPPAENQSHYDGEHTPLPAKRSHSSEVRTVHESEHKNYESLSQALAKSNDLSGISRQLPTKTFKSKKRKNQSSINGPKEQTPLRYFYPPAENQSHSDGEHTPKSKKTKTGGKTNKRLAKNMRRTYMARNRKNTRRKNTKRKNTRRRRKIRGGGNLTYIIFDDIKIPLTEAMSKSLFADIDDTPVITIIRMITNMRIDKILDSDIESNGIYNKTDIRDILKRAHTFLNAEGRVITRIEKNKNEGEINVYSVMLD